MDPFTPICSRCFHRPSQSPYRVCTECRKSRIKTYRSRIADQSTVHTDPPRPSKRRRLNDSTPQLQSQQFPHLPENTPVSSSTPLEPPLSSASPHLIFHTQAVPLNISRKEKRSLQRIAPVLQFSDQVQRRVSHVRIPHREPSPEQPDEAPDIDPLSSDDSDDAER